MTRSPRSLRRQIREAVGEHVRDLPIQAARLAMFGVGRALMFGDRVTKDYQDLRAFGPGPVLNRLGGDVRHLAGKAMSHVIERVAGPPEPVPPAEDIAHGYPVAQPPAKAGRAPLAEPEIVVGKPAPSGNGTGPAPAVGRVAQVAAKPKPKPTAAAKGKIAAASLPVPNYDEASLPALRGRLRNLSVEQIGLLRAYERENAARPNVLRMYENRIAKLTEGH